MHKIPARRVSDNPYSDAIQDAQDLVELYDSNDRPYLLVPLKIARRLKLVRRVVLVILRDAKNRIYIQRRAKQVTPYGDLWDVSSSGHVLAGESLEDAALRQLRNNLNITPVRLRRISTLPYRDNFGTSIFATYFTAGPCHTMPRPDPDLSSDGMFLDEVELRGLLEQQHDMFSPELVWGAISGRIFTK